MIIYDYKIFEDMSNNTKNSTCIIFSIIIVNLFLPSLYAFEMKKV